MSGGKAVIKSATNHKAGKKYGPNSLCKLKRKLDWQTLLRCADTRGELLLPFLISGEEDLNYLVNIAAGQSPLAERARRTLHALYYLVEWGPSIRFLVPKWPPWLPF